MTVYNWSSMSPRERDALVAEKVMGHEYYTIECQLTHEVFEYWRGDRDLKLRPYTTDISAAWEVVQKMHHTGCTMDLIKMDDTWNCTWFDDNDHPLKESDAPTAPEAICLAALKAVGVDIQ